MAIGRMITSTAGDSGAGATRDAARDRRAAQACKHRWQRCTVCSRRSQWLERLLLTAGILCLGYVFYVTIETHLYQAVENRELDAILASAPSSRTTAGVMPAAGSTIGRIEIPRLGVSAVVRAGSDARTLRLAVGHIPGTSLPGAGGNIALAGHRDTFFRRLQDIRAFDEIRLVTPSGTYKYEVDTTRIVKPKDTWVLEPTEVSMLTLVTCYPFSYVGTAPDRFIVKAVEVPSKPRQLAGSVSR